MTDSNLARLDLMSFFFGCFAMGAGLIFLVGVASFVGRCIKRMRGE